MGGSLAKRGQFIAGLQMALAPKGYNIRGPLAQADHETGRFRKVIGWNNFWGIKVPRRTPWTGKVVTLPTTEILKASDMAGICRFLNSLEEGYFIKSYYQAIKGRVVFRVKADFCDWRRERFALEYYDSLIRRLYPGAHAVRDKPTAFVRALVSGRRKWATDPDYMKKMRLHLDRVSREIL